VKLFKSFIFGILSIISLIIFASCGLVDTKDCPDKITVSSKSECENYCSRGGCDGYVDDATGKHCSCY